jgi:hypothetical protein
MPGDDGAAAERLERRFRRQAATALQRGSPLYLGLLERLSGDVAARGPAWELLRDRAWEPGGSALALRLLAAVHRLVLTGAAPELARWYPSAGGDGTAEQAWPDLRALLAERAAELDPLLDEPLQTNEPARAAALLPGLLYAATKSGQPLRLLELGASAGLNLNFDRYRYEDDGFAFGPKDSPVRIAGAYGGHAPQVRPTVTVASRAGCDRRPLDVRDEHDRLVLRSAVWADQAERLALLDAALAVAAAHPPPVERADALEWLDARLREPAEGVATVVMHSILVQYLSPEAREALHARIEEAGRAATPTAPLHWLRMEPHRPEPPAGDPRRGTAELRHASWPPGIDAGYGWAGYHGRPVELPRRVSRS